jgi:hypothetical protein
MPARRLPWFKLWPEAMRHEKIALLSDGAFRTWVTVLAAGSEQAVRWRFASVKHAVSVTGRPSRQIRELISARLIDESEDGELWVHDWRQWQDRYESDFIPRTRREDSANDPRSLPGEGRGEKRETERDVEATPQPPPREGERRRRGERANGPAAHDEATPPVALAPITPGDVATWNQARVEMAADMLPANAEKLATLEPIGRGPDGGLHLRAPPHLGLDRARQHVARALLDAGDTAGPRVVIVEAYPPDSTEG